MLRWIQILVLQLAICCVRTALHGKCPYNSMIYLLQMVNQKSIIYFDAFANWTSVDNGFSHEFPIKPIEKLQFSLVFSCPPRPYRRRPSLQCSRAAHRTRPGPGGSSVAPTQWPCPFCTAPVERGGTAVWNANFHRCLKSEYGYP